MGGKDELLRWLSSLQLCSWEGGTNWYVSYFPKDSLLKREVNGQILNGRTSVCSH